MRSISFRYPVLLAYETVRLIVLLRQGALSAISVLPVTWYAGAPLLCLVPFMLLMLLRDEDQFKSWLPLIALVKALGALALLAYAATTIPDAIRLADVSLLGDVLSALCIAILDAIVGVYCFGRNRSLCK